MKYFCRSNKKRISLSEHVAFTLFPNREYHISLFDALDRVKDLQSGKEFTIPELFSYQEYSKLTKGLAGTLGREFLKRVKSNEIEGVTLLGRRSRQNVYKKE